MMTWEIRNTGWPIPFPDPWPISIPKIKKDYYILEHRDQLFRWEFGKTIYQTEDHKGCYINIKV